MYIITYVDVPFFALSSFLASREKVVRITFKDNNKNRS